MSVNEGGADRFARWAIGIMLVLMAMSGTGWIGPLVMALTGATLLLTGAIGWCPLYSLFHVTSVHREA